MANAGAAMPHDFSGPVHERTMGPVDVTYCPYGTSLWHRGNPRLLDSSWTRTCKEQECASCGLRRIVKDSSCWTGTGIYSYLNGDDGNGTTAEPPLDPKEASNSYTGYFTWVPPPPAGCHP